MLCRISIPSRRYTMIASSDSTLTVSTSCRTHDSFHSVSSGDIFSIKRYGGGHFLYCSVNAISYGEDNQTVTLSLAPPATKWPERIVWYDRNVSLENFVLTLGESQLGPVTVDLRTNAHILLGGVTGSGKTVLLKVLLRQAIDKGAKVYIADFKGGVDFKSWFRENCYMSYDMDTTLETLAEWENELDRRKTLLRDSNCSNIDEYNAMFTETKLHRWAFACDEIAMMLDKTGQSKEQKEKIDKAKKASTLRPVSLKFCGS